MTDPSSHLTETNLSQLPAATARALRAATAQPSVSVQTTDVGLKASIRIDDGRWVPVHTSADPNAAADRAVERFAAKQPTLVLVVGLGLGYLLDALERRGSTTGVLAIEPIPAITLAMLGRRDWTTWLESGRLTILAGPDYPGASEAWGLLGPGASTPPTIMSRLLEREFAEAASRAAALVRQIVASAKANVEARAS